MYFLPAVDFVFNIKLNLQLNEANYKSRPYQIKYEDTNRNTKFIEKHEYISSLLTNNLITKTQLDSPKIMDLYYDKNHMKEKRVINYIKCK